jgi:2-polyprenyl-3-methyl-5-hydroxy-6-metoxy-1,4-benzoquinol methylase
MNNKRVKGTIIAIDNSSVNDFFKDRASKYNQNNPLKAVLYQDNNPQIAIDRDLKEKKKLLPLLNLIKSTKVLDIGCGIGRWAKTMAPLVHKYHGTDLMPQFIDIAKEECKEFSNVTFQSISAQEITDTSIDGKFNLIFISGLLIYLNDNEIRNLFNVLNSYMENHCQILIREPIGIEERLTLNKVWSEELQCEYSAVYRTVQEYKELFLNFQNTKCIISSRLYEQNLNNREETAHYYFILEKVIYE